MKIGKRIKKWRKDAKMTQEQLGEIVGVTGRTIRKIESCDPKITLTLQRINQICKIFGYVAEFKVKRIEIKPIETNTNTEEN